MSKRELSVLLLMWAIGAFGAWQFFSYTYAKNNTPEKIIQRTINESIQADLCERIDKDVQLFKNQPKTFQRVSLNAINTESKIALRHLLRSSGVPEDHPLEFTGSGSPYSKCSKNVKMWIGIPSTGSQTASEELQQAGLGGAEFDQSHAANPIEKSSRNKGKLALIIGNSTYRSRPLLNPKNDSDDIASFLIDSGFEVIRVNNASFIEMQEAIKRYSDKLKENDVGLVFYSGHGVEYKGRNYLLPVDVSLSDEEDVPRQTIDASGLVDQVSRAEGKLNIIIIDACRSNFIPAKNRSLSQGLAKMDGLGGTIVAFSTAPGMVAEDGNGRNSPYTKNLIKAMSVPGRKIEDVFKETAKMVEIETIGRQVPWYNSSILVDFSIR